MHDIGARYSRVYTYQGKHFIYDWQESLVLYVLNIPFDSELDKPEDYIRGKWWIADSVGLRRENWQNKERRDEYLSEYCADLDYELAAMTADLKKEFGL